MNVSFTWLLVKVIRGVHLRGERGCVGITYWGRDTYTGFTFDQKCSNPIKSVFFSSMGKATHILFPGTFTALNMTRWRKKNRKANYCHWQLEKELDCPFVSGLSTLRKKKVTVKLEPTLYDKLILILRSELTPILLYRPMNTNCFKGSFSCGHQTFLTKNISQCDGAIWFLMTVIII